MTTTEVRDTPSKFWSCYFISQINLIAISFFLFYGILTYLLFLFKPNILSKNLRPLLFGFLIFPFILKMTDAFLIYTQLEKEKKGSSVIFFASVLFVFLQILILSNRKFQKISTIMINNLNRIIVEIE